MNQEGGPEPLEIAKYFHVIKRRAWLISLVALFVALCVVGLSIFQADIYTAETEILVTTLPREEVSDIPTQAQFIRSSAVSQRVQESLALEESPHDLGELIVEPMLGSQVIAVSYTTSSASLAQEVANEFTAQYLSFRRELARESIRAVRQQVEQAKAVLADLSAAVANTSRKSERGRALRAEEKVHLARTRLLQAKLVDLETVQLRGGRVLQPAALPERPIGSNPLRQGGLGLFLGLLIGTAFAFYVEARSNRFRRTVELEKIVGGPVLGVVPAGDGLVVASGATGVEAEAFRKLRSRVQFLTTQEGLRSLAITSAVETDARSSMVANLCAALALSGTRVVLVSADLRAAAVEKIVKTREAPGLFEWLSGGNADPMSLVHESEIEGLHVLPAGNVSPSSSELIASPLIGDLIIQLNKQFDLAILDTPPAIATVDARIVGAAVDGVVIAIDARRDTPPLISSKSRLAQSEIESVGGRVVGYVVISDVDDTMSNP